MLDVLRTATCNRPLFFLLFGLLAALDVAKGPIERFLDGFENQAVERLYPLPSPAPERLPRSFAEGGGEAADDEFRDATRHFHENMPEIVAESTAKQLVRVNVESTHVGILMVVGLASLGLAVWMIFARVNDIGWHSLWGLAFAAPWLVTRLTGAGMPDALHALIQGGFILGLVVLGLWPPAGSGPKAEAPRLAAAGPIGRVGAQPGGFGRRR